MPSVKPLLILALCHCLYTQPLCASAGHDHAEEQSKEHVTLSAEAAKTAGIETEIAGPATISDTVKVTGQIMLNPNQSVDVRARFPGVIKEVYANVGDVVKKDQTLVKIESNGTLEHYTVTAPQDGTIITRNTNIGDLSQEKLLFTISDLSKLWAKYHVFPNDIAKIKKGDPVEVLSLDNKYHTNSTISFISPIVDPLTQSVFAVAEVPTSSEPWRAGTIIKGIILVSKQQVPLAVKVSALQKRKEATVVFIQNGDEFQAKEVKLGKSDQEWVEVLSGITPGTNYVVKNSFIIKSELEKAGASHEH